MPIELICVITLLVFLTVALMEVPIGLSLLMAGSVGVVLTSGREIATTTLTSVTYQSTSKYVLIVIPMFVLLGCLVANSGVGEQIYEAANRVVGRLPGGLAATTVVATTIFSGISGSSAADIGTIGKVAAKEMRRNGYTPQHAVAVVAAASAFAVLVPPSIVLVLYALIAGVPVGRMLLAGVVPGVLSGAVLAAAVVAMAVVSRHRKRGVFIAATPLPANTADDMLHEQHDRPAKVAMGLIYAGSLFVIVIGGLYAGLFTATESAAVGAFAAFAFAILSVRGGNEQKVWPMLKQSLSETANVTSMIFLLLIGGGVLTFFLASSGVVHDLTEWVLDLPVSPTVILVAILLLMLPLGMFLDGLSAMLLVVPVVTPIMLAAGFDGIWIGILVIKMVEIGLITPPVGLNVFIACGLVKDCPPERVFMAMTPFVLLDLAVVGLLLAFPEIVTWLPDQAYGGGGV